MIKTILKISGGLAVLGVLIYAGLPKLLNLLGLHPHYKGRKFFLPGKKALIITTSQDTLEDGKPTGVYASEMTVPYYQFLDSGMDVDIASIKGGEVPIEGQSLRWPVRTEADFRYLNDPEFQGKTKNSLKIDDLDFTGYDAVFMAGGWGAAFDMGSSEVLGQKTTEAYVDGAVLGSVCHGALGLLNTKDENGALLLQGRKITGVTDKQVKELGGMDTTPQHPETELRKVGVDYQCETAVLDALADLTVVDGRIVTGQNQNAGAETAQRIMALIEEGSK